MLRKKSIKKNAILNAVKQLCQVLFSLITIPYITRVLSPDSYGMVNFSSSFVSYFSLLAGLGISTYAIREGAKIRNEKEKFENLASNLFSFNIYSMILSYGFLFLFLIFPYFEKYRILIMIHGLTIFFTTFGADWINSIYEDYLYITIRYIIFQIISIILLLIFVHKPSDYLIYSLITIFSIAGANISNMIYVRKYVHLKFKIRPNIKKHIISILVLFGNAIAITIYVNSDITMLGLLQTDTSVGIYSLTSKIYSVIKLILNGILIVSLPRISYYIGIFNNYEMNKLLNKIYNIIITMCLPIVVIVCFLSKEILIIMGGKDFVDGYRALIVLSITILFSMIAFFYTNCILIPFKKERIVLIITVISAIFNVILNLFMIPYYGYVGTAITTLVAEAMVAVFGMIIVHRLGVVKLNCNINNVIATIAGSISVAIICCIIKKVGIGELSIIVIASILSVVCYITIQVLLKNEIILNELLKFKNVIKNKN